MFKKNLKIVEKKEIRDNQPVIIKYEEVTEEFISLEQQLSILKKAKKDSQYYKDNYENLIEFELDLARELGDEFWNENWYRYFKNDEDLLELVESLKFLKILPAKFTYIGNHIKIIFSEIYDRGLDKPQHLDLVNASELNWIRYGNFESSSKYYDFQKKKEKFLKFGKNDFPLQQFEEENLTTFDTELTTLLGEEWNDGYSNIFFTDKDKVYLFKGLILLEKFLGNGSSVAKNIMVFQELERLNLLTPELLDWTFKNKSENVYTPFGWARYGHIRSYKEYVDFAGEYPFKGKSLTYAEIDNTEDKKKRDSYFIIRVKSLIKRIFN